MTRRSRRSRRSRRRTLALAAALACALTLAACGAGNDKATHAATEGVYVYSGPLAYQVQISRQLNPRDVEDSGYLVGLTPAQARLTPQQTWFAVFVRVANETKRSYTTAGDFTIADSKDNVYRPIPTPPVNLFGYRPTLLEAGKVLPTGSSIAGQGVVQGSMLLFKLPFSSFDDRPLVLHVAGPSQRDATVELDV